VEVVEAGGDQDFHERSSGMRVRRRVYMLVCPNRKKNRREWGDGLHSFVQVFGGNRKRWEHIKKLWGDRVCALCGAELEEVIRE
jgi:hypothetical protein